MEALTGHLFRRYIPGVGYGTSSLGEMIVTADPFVLSQSRIFIVLTIGIGMIISMAVIWHSFQVNEKLLRTQSTKSTIYGLCVCASLSLCASGIHHIDNFVRVPDYFIWPWIYNGMFFILDVGLANWVLGTCLLLYGCCSYMNSQTVNAISTGRENKYYDRLYVWCIYAHCFIFWTGLLHYSIEHFSKFRIDCNISILFEAGCAIFLHCYSLMYMNGNNDGAVPLATGNNFDSYDDMDEYDNGDLETTTLLRRRSR